MKTLLSWLCEMLVVVPPCCCHREERGSGPVQGYGREMKIIQPGGRSAAQHNGVYRPGAEFVLRPAGGGVDRSERWRSSRDRVIIKPRHTQGECVVMVAVVVDEFSLHMERLKGGCGPEEHITPKIGFVFRGRWLRSTWLGCGEINGPIGPNGCGCQIGLLLIREEYWL